MKTQQGMVLLLCLIFLTALTLLGLSASAEAILQKKLTANLKESEHARQSALSALSWAEDWLFELQGEAPAVCTDTCGGLKLHAGNSLAANPEFKDLVWWAEQGHEAGIDPVTGVPILNLTHRSISAPMWVIEVAHEISPVESGSSDLRVWYRITARGHGLTSAGVSVVESIVVRSWPVSEETEPEAAVISGRVAWRELR